MTETTAPTVQWAVVVPVKLLAQAKTRLVVPDVVASADVRSRLALAMTVDTVTAALRCPVVRLVVTVTDDPVASSRLAAAGAHVVPDRPDAGLNPALAHGARAAARLAPDAGIAAMSSDLPALRPWELATALGLAAACECGVVADTAGSGTTLLTARPGVVLPVAFGAGSFDRHVAAGASPLHATSLPGLRRDVDTWQDLLEAERLGLGVDTAAVLAQVREHASDRLR